MSNRRQGFRRLRRPSAPSSTLHQEPDANAYREERPLTELHPELSIYDELPLIDTTTTSQLDTDFNVCKFPVGDLDVNVKPSQVPTFRLAEKAASSFDASNPYLLQIGYNPQNETSCAENYYRFISHDDELLDEATSNDAIFHGFNPFVRVEYDMDKCDFEYLRALNKKRTSSKVRKLRSVSREAFEATMTLLEIAWFSLEQRMPPRKKLKVTDEIPDSEDQKCVICDDGECDNNNVIVFCDGCDIGVHQDCYGVPFIPEGQWLCRACQASRKKLMDCIFCPNKSGAFKRTTTGEWAHLVCSLWIPETRISDPIFIEPVTGIDRIDKNRWKLVCYICKKRMGACIQCSSKKCPQAYHATCGRKARLFMKMCTGIQGALLDQSTVISYCDKHSPPDHKPKVDVRETLRSAKEYYRNKVDHVVPDKCEIATGVEQPWKTKGGIPAIPASIAVRVRNALQEFKIQECEDFVNEAARYWALKRESKKGAYLLKRLQNASSDIDVDIDYSAAKLKLQSLKVLHWSLDNLKSIAEKGREVELSKLAISRGKEGIIRNIVIPFMPSLKLIWDTILERDQKLAISRNSKDLSISNNPKAVAITKKIQNLEYPSILDFKNDLFHLLQSHNSPYYVQRATKFRAVADLMIRRVQLAEKNEVSEFLPELLNTPEKSRSQKPSESGPKVTEDEPYDYQVKYHLSSARKRKRLIDDEI